MIFPFKWIFPFPDDLGGKWIFPFKWNFPFKWIGWDEAEMDFSIQMEISISESISLKKWILKWIHFFQEMDSEIDPFLQRNGS